MEDEGGERSSIVIGLIENRAKEFISEYKTLLHFYDPMVIIVTPNKLAPDGMVGVSELVDRFYATVKKVVMGRGCFDDTKGAVLIKNLAAKEPSALGLDTYYKQYYLCLAATAATVKWTEAEKGVIVTNHSLLVTFNGSFDHMNIDATSHFIRAQATKKRSLFHMLKTTKTIGGTRLLRANLLQPLKDIETINARLDCLDELMSTEQLFFGLSQVLRKFPKRDQKYASIRKRIGEVIDEDVLHARVPFVCPPTAVFAVKAGIDGILDIARRSFCDTSEGKVCYFSIPQKEYSNGKLPSKFIQVLKHGKQPYIAHSELASLNVRNKSAAAECYIRTEVCLKMPYGRMFLCSLSLRRSYCLLDMIVNSLCSYISTKPVDRYTRPEFTDNGPMAIDAGRHPILESIHNDFIPNNIFLSEASNMVIVMGPTCKKKQLSGKSTYLQQVCLTVILAQIVDRIFTRMGTVDNLESNSSTFMTEMRETAFVIQNVSRRSLIVMDELGRATSSSDGFAIAWSCCEYLYTIFATHMENLSELATIYPNVKILHFHVDIRNNRLDFKFELKDEVAGLPSSVIETARSITSRITEKEVKRMEVNYLQYHPIQMAYRVAQRLICLKYSSQDEDSIRQALQDLKEQYIDGRL
ncbi:hypothetical protein RGQ29_007542 [Quercus rubra]|uniref:DNA mismatch repair proteins mutS family domain-containing protein n=1 Tax=Quercus rubra TaxID=3512 RepID=A0AAN7DXJ2_QUERU|nr:hypothetical protein RGQ29_007542 [Quercus rubra]